MEQQPTTPHPSPLGIAAGSAVLGPADLAVVDDYTLYDALIRLRPELFRGRRPAATAPTGRAMVLYINGTRIGNIGRLRTVPRAQVREVVLLSGCEAVKQYGPGHEGGAVIVTLGQPPPGEPR